MANFAPYNQYGVARYRPGCLIDATAEFITATNTANIPQAPFSFNTVGGGMTYLAGENLVIKYVDPKGFETAYTYTIPAGVFNSTLLGEFVAMNFAGQLTFYSPAALFGTGVVQVMPNQLGIDPGYVAPSLSILNTTTNVTLTSNLTFGPEKRIVPGRVIVRDYVNDDLFHAAFPGSARHQNRGFLHTVRPCDQVAAAAGVLNFAGVSGNPSMHQSNNRNGLRSTGMYDSVICYRRALILVDTIPGQFGANVSNVGQLFAETTPGNEGKIRATATATTVPLPTSGFSFVSARGYAGAAIISVNTI